MLIPRAEPLPQAEHYARAFDEANREMQAQGGLRLYLANRALMVTVDRELEAQETALAYYGLRFVDSTANFDDDDSYDACYAYINGYMATKEVADRAFMVPHSFHDRLSSLDQWFEQEQQLITGSADETLDEERKILEQFGVYGLRQIGDNAVGFLQSWANEAYPERERFARAFCLGSGALITCGVLHQRALNHQAAAQAVVEDDFDTALQKLLSGEGM